jgi:hypothetical protein
MKEQPECKVDKYGDKRWLLHGSLHREDGPAIEYHDGSKSWFLNDKLVHPEQIVDYHLIRGVFCYYNQQTGTLHFAENK